MGHSLHSQSVGVMPDGMLALHELGLGRVTPGGPTYVDQVANQSGDTRRILDLQDLPPNQRRVANALASIQRQGISDTFPHRLSLALHIDAKGHEIVSGRLKLQILARIAVKIPSASANAGLMSLAKRRLTQSVLKTYEEQLPVRSLASHSPSCYKCTMYFFPRFLLLDNESDRGPPSSIEREQSTNDGALSDLEDNPIALGLKQPHSCATEGRSPAVEKLRMVTIYVRVYYSFQRHHRL